jgi:hypothetical protein
MIIKNNKESLILNTGVLKNVNFKELILGLPPKQNFNISRKVDNLNITFNENSQENTWGCLDNSGNSKKNYILPEETKGIRKSNPNAIVTNQEFDEYLISIFNKLEKKISVTELNRRIKQEFDSSDVMNVINTLLEIINKEGNFKFHIMELVILNTGVDSNSKYYDFRLIAYNTMGYGSMKTIDALIVKRSNEETGVIETFYHTIYLVGYNSDNDSKLNGYDNDPLNTYGEYKLPYMIDPALNNEVNDCVNNRNLLCRDYPKLSNLGTSEEIY